MATRILQPGEIETQLGRMGEAQAIPIDLAFANTRDAYRLAPPILLI
jgi:hypothetical protein